MEIKATIERRDWVRFRLFHLLHRTQTRYACLAWAGLPPVGLAAALFALLACCLPGPIRFTSTWLPALLLLPLYVALFVHVKKRQLNQALNRHLEADKAPSLLGEFVVLLSEEGVTVSCGTEKIHRSWLQVSSVVANGDYGYIYTGADQAIIVPQHAFPDHEGFSLFMKMAIIYHWNLQSLRVPTSNEPDAPTLRWQEKGLEPVPLIPA